MITMSSRTMIGAALMVAALTLAPATAHAEFRRIELNISGMD